MDSGEWTEEQTDKVLQFQDVTSIEDLNICRNILIRNQWNLEIAIREHLNIQDNESSINTVPPVSENQLPHMLSRINPSIQPIPFSAKLFDFFGSFSNYIYNACFSTMNLVTIFFNAVIGRSNNQITEPINDVLKFIQNYDKKYPQHPIFYQGTYAQALTDAKQNLKFLLVYLHSDSPQVQQFCSQTLSNYEVVQYINQHMLFWGCDILLPEGYRVSNIVHARDYPFLIVSGLRDNRMIMLGLMVGTCSPTELLRRFEVIVTENTVYLNQARQERLERIVTQLLRQQQDEAYNLSLKADEEKEKLRQIQRNEVLKAELNENNKLLEQQIRQDKINQLKIELIKTVPIEPTENSKNSIHLVFMLPNGERIQRRFLITNSIYDVHNFVFCHPNAPEKLEITTNFPKIILYSDNLPKTLKSKKLNEIGLTNREVLFVNDLGV